MTCTEVSQLAKWGGASLPQPHLLAIPPPVTNPTPSNWGLGQPDNLPCLLTSHNQLDHTRAQIRTLGLQYFMLSLFSMNSILYLIQISIIFHILPAYLFLTDVHNTQMFAYLSFRIYISISLTFFLTPENKHSQHCYWFT